MGNYRIRYSSYSKIFERGLKIKNNTYHQKFQFPAPQIISVDNITSLTKAISDLYKDKNLCNERECSQLKKWFDEFNSYNTVHQLINLIDSK